MCEGRIEEIIDLCKRFYDEKGEKDRWMQENYKVGRRAHDRIISFCSKHLRDFKQKRSLIEKRNVKLVLRKVEGFLGI